MPNPEVCCDVRSCAYWLPQDRCGADGIKVSGPNARTPGSTECATFEPRGASNMINAAGHMDLSAAVLEPFAPGRQLTPGVTCVVEPCYFWKQGNLCGADKIDIRGGHQAARSAMTDCSTFELKG